MYPYYKRNREETPKEIIEALPMITSLLDAANIKYMKINGIEADDIIGTITEKAFNNGFSVSIGARDKVFKLFNFKFKIKIGFLPIVETWCRNGIHVEWKNGNI